MSKKSHKLKDFLPKLNNYFLNSRIRQIHLLVLFKNRWKNKPGLAFRASNQILKNQVSYHSYTINIASAKENDRFSAKPSISYPWVKVTLVLKIVKGRRNDVVCCVHPLWPLSLKTQPKKSSKRSDTYILDPLACLTQWFNSVLGLESTILEAIATCKIWWLECMWL